MDHNLARAESGRQAGFTLVETILTIVLIGFAIVVAAAVQEKATAASEAKAVVEALGSLTSKVRQNLGARGNYSELTPRVIYDMGLVAPPFRWDGTNILDPWGNAVAISAAPAGNSPSFVVAIGGASGRMNVAACSQIMHGLASAADQITAGANVTYSNGVVTQGWWVKSKTTPFYPDRVGFACAGASPLVIALQFH